MVKVAEQAPVFESVMAYQAGEFKKVSLGDHKGKWVVLFFYPRDFTFVCPTEIREFAELENEFEAANAMVIGASTDSEYSHRAWFEKDLPEVKYPVLADTTQEVSEMYNVLGADGASQRGTFIIDPDGDLRWMNVSDNSVGRSVKEVIRALKALQTGELCPADWAPGSETLGKE
ncbi:MAG: thioredoxin peroxidase [Candidatus Harrisonbacteria bacterium CG10_big_fil_rev_8_21_14_0_10_44_23]|uniref:Thioredoxin peroxidase n=1 Tax=Candidatus Harrisonbacteria bacterium CG10_big_fil_rev_8_21_14_0_10_44_23 TaxID=1974585 RepID=A0A2H0UQT4_9BACT|nr:MAG: thioredoxin peroxidase [Candidatus Harrisonbacteria bacterium CG10_big_fil_rev_8_21_14_0_10_44_23]